MQAALPKYADVILPLAINQYYTYKVPETIRQYVKIGCRVTVVLGKHKIYTALIRYLHDRQPEDIEIREILSLLDEEPVVSDLHIRFWEWLSEYYMCTTGEVYNAAFPAGLKLESQTQIYLQEDNEEKFQLSATEQALLKRVTANPGITIDKLVEVLGKKDWMPSIKKMVEKGLLTTEEKLKTGYKPKIVQTIELTEDWQKESELQELLDKLEKKAPKQAVLVNAYLDLNIQENKLDKKSVDKDKLIKKARSTTAAMNSLIHKKIFRVKLRETSRISFTSGVRHELRELTTRQSEVCDKIRQLFKEKDVVLLHGVTSSGKTEIYIHLIHECIQQGKQVLYLLPEIALTAQIIQRLRNVFGDTVGVYHSKFSDSERVEVFRNIVGFEIEDSPSFQIILGVRSSIFLPFKNIGLIIIDEEHEYSYKQFEPAPRYNARDAAIMLASMHKARVLMGTATPSFESYMNAIHGRYGLAELTDRFSDIKLPEIKIIDIREARRKKKMKSHFSPLLIDEIAKALRNNDQAILFQNRRGYSPYIECRDCGTVPLCKNCDVSLTYHKNSNLLKCHYCGFTIANPAHCNACGSPDLLTMGFGTEKIEDEIRIFFPEAKVARMDLDTTHTRKSYEKIIADFENRKVDILVGTQMISKGLDFDHVKVVGVLNADNMLNYPDFRSFERCYQLIAQVSGRAGRKNERGVVVLQTSDPAHTVIKHFKFNDYQGFFNEQVAERKTFLYPPYVRLVKLTLRHKKISLLNQAADKLAYELRSSLGNRVVGPEFPLINRLYGYHQKCILVKLDRDKIFLDRKRLMLNAISHVNTSVDFKGIRIIADVDPYN